MSSFLAFIKLYFENSVYKFWYSMATSEPSDQELLQCPEAVEPQFIHRGRADMITPQAGKSKKKLQKKGGGASVNFQHK